MGKAEDSKSRWIGRLLRRSRQAFGEDLVPEARVQKWVYVDLQ